MLLTTDQRNSLETFRNLKAAERVTLFHYISLKMLIVDVAVAIFIASALATGVFKEFPLWTALLGVFLGMCMRDLGQARASLRFWPIFAEIIDWSRVDELLDPPTSEQPG